MAVVVGVAAVVALASFAPGASATGATTDASMRHDTAAADAPPASTATESNDTTAVVARYRAANGSMVERVAFAPRDVAFVGAPVNDSRIGLWRVPMRLTDGGADRFAETVDAAGFTGEARSCPRTEGRNDQGRCLLVLVDGEVAASFGLGQALVEAVESGQFEANPQFVLAADDESEALAVWRAFQNDTGTTSADADTASGPETSTDAAGESTDDGAGGPTADVAGGSTDDGSRTTTRAASTTDSVADPVETRTTTESFGTPGFGVLAAVVAVVTWLGVARRRAT